MSTESMGGADLADAGVTSSQGIFGLALLTPERLKRLVKFGLVGVSGVFVNLAVFEVLFRMASMQFSVANALGIVVSIFTNFLLNDMWTWGDRVKGARRRDWFGRLTKYYVSASVAAGVQLLVASAAVALVFDSLIVDIPAVVPVEPTSIDIGPTLAVLTGIIVGMGINFLASHLWAFRDAEVKE
ncbi:GtrA family protein [Persicimonas caeni]|nr:GtrA family protein [Persicimonas caeni]